jgi:hypothetical protein
MTRQEVGYWIGGIITGSGLTIGILWLAGYIE